jgi:hypothetical protein
VRFVTGDGVTASIVGNYREAGRGTYMAFATCNLGGNALALGADI